MSYRILVAEDDRSLNEGIRLALAQEGVVLEAAYTVEEAYDCLRRMQPDMLLLDRGFPDGSGLELLRRLRRDSDIPVLMITGDDQEIDEVKGLALGADDYITKPFGLMALRARVEAIRRRTEQRGGRKGAQSAVYEKGGYRFDFERLQFFADGREVSLSSAEQKLLRLFTSHPMQTLPRGRLAEALWVDGTEYVDENALSVTVSRLRKKLEIQGAKSPIGTVYGIGYVWNV